MTGPDEEREERLAAVIAEIQDEMNGGGMPDREAWILRHPEFRDEIGRFLSFETFVESVLLPSGNAPRREGKAPELDLGAFPIRRRLDDGPLGPIYLLSSAGPEAPRELVVLPLELAGDASDRLRELTELARRLEIPGIGLPRRLDAFESVPFLLRDHVEGRSLADALGRVAAGGGAVESAAAFAGADGPADRPERARRREIAARLATRRSHLTPLLATFAGWARALDRAHAAGVVHGGLAPEDLLVDVEGEVGIRGFGDSPLATGRAPRSFPEDRQRWFAPEYLDRRLGHPSYLSDVHAFGLVLASALALDLPRWEEDGAAALECSTRADLDLDGFLPRGLPAGLIRLLESCVARRPENRPRDLALVAERLDALRRGESPRRPGSLLAVVLAALALAAILFLTRICSN